MEDKIKILHVFGTMNKGGAELRTLEVMKELKDEFDFSFCVLSGKRGVLDDEIKKMGGTIHYCKVKSLLFPFRFLKILKQNSIKIVHSHVHYFSGLILMLSRLASVRKRIAHFRNTNDGNSNEILNKFKVNILMRWVEKHSTNILGVCEGALQHTLGDNWAADSRAQVIYNGFNIDKVKALNTSQLYREFPVLKGSKVFIHVGRFNKQKNQTKVVEIFNEILKREPGAYLLLVGKRNEEVIFNQTINKIKEYSIERSVLILGERSDVLELMNIADLHIFPSLWEGLPGSVLEAALVGTPTVGSNIPGIKEISERTPLVSIMEINKDSEAWAEKITETLDNQNKDFLLLNKQTFDEGDFSFNKSADKYKYLWKKK